LGSVSAEIGQPLSAYINRRGQVIRVGVGTPRQTQIPPLELPRYGAERLCGIRCLTTELQDRSPSKGSLTAMVIQRLDALVVLEVSSQGFQKRGGGSTGYVQSTYLAHLMPDPQNPWHLSESTNLDQLVEQDFLDFVQGLEEEFQRQVRARQVDSNQDQVLIVGLQTQVMAGPRFEENLGELQRLVESAGGKVLDVVRQRRPHPHPQTVIGEGKVEEVALVAQTLGANLIVFDRDLSPAQGRNLERILGVRVVDRTEVILDIFAQRAQSSSGKLQVELAQLEYCLPRLTGRGQAMSRLGGGIGTRGPGETKLETERRAIQNRIAKLQREVNQLQAHRSRLRQHRQNQQVLSIAIVGYTNAGKSTLLNTLTTAEVYTADQLFATLDPTTRRFVIPASSGAEDPLTLLLTDTVGFIHELPPPLVDSFRATLEEVTEADALLHLVDLSHPAWMNQTQSVAKILAELPLAPGPSLLVFNKVDQVSSEALALAQEKFPQAVFVSAQQQLGLNTLRQRLRALAETIAEPQRFLL
jgi:GTP-binding protein HflX